MVPGDSTECAVYSNLIKLKKHFTRKLTTRSSREQPNNRTSRSRRPSSQQNNRKAPPEDVCTRATDTPVVPGPTTTVG